LIESSSGLSHRIEEIFYHLIARSIGFLFHIYLFLVERWWRSLLMRSGAEITEMRGARREDRREEDGRW
jgi:hypothetical protein